LSDRLALVLTAALCAAASAATPAMAADLPDDGAPAFSSRPYAQLFAAATEPALEPAPEPPALPTLSLAQEAAKAQPPPEPQHTGFSALLRSTGSDFVAFPRNRTSPASGLAKPHRLSHETRVRAHIPSCFSSFWNCRCFSFAAASRFA